MSVDEKRWINEYNARIRELVGEELKKRNHMKAFYWMMNKTRHVKEYLPESELRGGSISERQINFSNLLLTILLSLVVRLFI